LTLSKKWTVFLQNGKQTLFLCLFSLCESLIWVRQEPRQVMYHHNLILMQLLKKVMQWQKKMGQILWNLSHVYYGNFSCWYRSFRNFYASINTHFNWKKLTFFGLEKFWNVWYEIKILSLLWVNLILVQTLFDNIQEKLQSFPTQKLVLI